MLKHLRRLGKPEFDPHVLQEPRAVPGRWGGELDDPMFDQAARLVVVVAQGFGVVHPAQAAARLRALGAAAGYDGA